MNEPNHDRLLDTSLEELPREIPPDRDLWPGIERAIELRESSESGSKNKLSFAAAIVVLAIGSAGMLSLFHNSDTPNSSEVNMAMLVDDMDRGFTIQKATMLSVYEGKASLTANWRDQLQELEDARNGIRQALKENPDNVYMIQILHRIQQHQLDLIRNVHMQINRNI